jgi:hypothetical protein
LWGRFLKAEESTGYDQTEEQNSRDHNQGNAQGVNISGLSQLVDVDDQQDDCSYGGKLVEGKDWRIERPAQFAQDDPGNYDQEQQSTDS